MKTIITTLLFLVCWKAFCQNPTFETLKLNSSPAFVILGVDPQNIQRPNSPTDFIAGAQSSIVNGKLQPNFALETSPYYWKHPRTANDKRISVFDFLKPTSNVFENISKSFTFSFASSDSDTLAFGQLKPGMGLGMGVKFNLLNGGLSKKTLMQVGSLIENKLINNLYQSILGQLQVGNNVNVSSRINSWKNLKKTGKSGDEERDKLVDLAAQYVRRFLGKEQLTSNDIDFVQLLIDKNNEIESKTLAVMNAAVLPLTREGFMLEVAIANASIIQGNEWKKTRSAKTAFWITPSYRFNTRKDPTVVDYFDLLGVFRIILNDKMVDVTNYIDVGTRFQYTHNRVSLSGEYIARMLTTKPASVDSKWTNRLDLSLDYKVNEFITFKATFGRNFDGTSVHYSDPGKMFAVGGFNFGFSDFFKMNTSSQ